ncbi:ABC transporter ATP-binding protein [Rubrobacter aplysinae]|uniref:ABC transporter ATP-binding protein n=1 Tax=Rubrobacter aplysinae TaxID=909625 RepID=UPI00064BE973
MEARGLKKSYEGFEAVRGVDFEVYEGECFGFLGPNGAGKTSTMKMIYNAAVPSGGELDVVGLDVGREARRVKQRIGVVPQENNPDEDLTVRENLVVYGRYFGLGRKEISNRADEMLEFVQLSEKSGDRVEQLSGGMKRRLLIARSLMNDPDLVVLDEPTTGLDPQARHLVWEKLRELKRRGKTLILTTHYMDEAAQLCDRLVIMEGGRIISSGSPQTLIKENVSPEVVEFRAERGGPDSLDSLAPVIEAEADSVERTADAIYAYTSEPDRLIERVRASGAGVGDTLKRRSSLEDVFLNLTGRGLVD